MTRSPDGTTERIDRTRDAINPLLPREGIDGDLTSSQSQPCGEASADAEVFAGLDAERAAIAAEARRYAEFYPQSSDGRNTFVMFAEWVEDRK